MCGFFSSHLPLFLSLLVSLGIVCGKDLIDWGDLGGRGGREGFDWEKGPYGCECKKDEQAGKTNILESE